MLSAISFLLVLGENVGEEGDDSIGLPVRPTGVCNFAFVIFFFLWKRTKMEL